MAKEREIGHFADAAAFEAWLVLHFERADGLWLKIAKRGTEPSISYAEALDCALCFGWIDGQKAKLDEQSWLQYFVRRKKDSLWSQRNKEHVARLIEQGRMRDAGLAAVREAKQNGRWAATYQPTGSREVPADFLAALQGRPQALAFFESLGSQNRFAFVFRVSTAKKPETRQRRIAEFVDMLEHGKTFHPVTPAKASASE